MNIIIKKILILFLITIGITSCNESQKSNNTLTPEEKELVESILNE